MATILLLLVLTLAALMVVQATLGPKPLQVQPLRVRGSLTRRERLAAVRAEQELHR